MNKETFERSVEIVKTVEVLQRAKSIVKEQYFTISGGTKTFRTADIDSETREGLKDIILKYIDKRIDELNEEFHNL